MKRGDRLAPAAAAGAAPAVPAPAAPDPRGEAPSGAPGLDPASLAYDAEGLLPVVVQDVGSGAVLMVAWADRDAVERTLATGEAHFWSRSRRRPWKKGETSGNVLDVVDVTPDCDADTLLVRARPRGPACHRGTRTCFEPNPARLELGWLARVIAERAGADPESSYTARLLAGGGGRIAKKVGEEAAEVVVAALTGGRGEAGEETTAAEGELPAETADLLYHLLVLLAERGVDLGAVTAELERRHRTNPVAGRGPEDG